MTDDDKKKASKVVGWLKVNISKQKKAIRKVGMDPTWEFFSASFGWSQIRKRMKNNAEFEKLYEQLWKEVP